ncbi:conjugal transfer protein [Streptococcus acidominimus]|uniref:Conjugal transfer protein n=2 Tax=Streptococcus acidominimus TaxID=1326 RepID=A0A4Y9FSL3_STRAI|nr:conjugal transfer protein [Streptococcus acidominimus]
MIANTMSLEGKEAVKLTSASVVTNLKKYVDFEINDIPMPRDVVGILEQLGERVDSHHVYVDLANTIFNKMVEGIYKTTGEPFESRYYVTVPLKSIYISMDMVEVLRQSYRHTKNVIMQGLGLTEEVSDTWYESYLQQRLVLEEDLGLLSPRRTTVEETILLNRIQYLRGLYYEKDVEVVNVQSSIDNLDDVNIHFENVNVLKLSNQYGTSYVGLHPIDTLPVNVSYLHLMEEVHKLNFPVESKVKVHFPRTKGYFSLAGEAGRAKDKVRNAVLENEEEGDGPKNKQVVDHHLLEDIQNRLDSGEVMLTYLHTLVITSDTLEGLNEKRAILKATLKNLGVGLLDANADQLYLFFKNRIGEVLDYSDRNFIQKMSVRGFAENLFFVSQKVGTEVGFYLGKVDSKTKNWLGNFRDALVSSSNLVFTDVLEANKQGVDGKVTNSPHIAVTGDTGNGKSFLLKLLFVYHSLLRTKCLYIDPKDEIKWQFLEVANKLEKEGLEPELVAYIRSFNFVSLDVKKKENRGMLDPIVFLDAEEGKSLAETMVKTIKPSMTDRQETALLKAIKEVYKAKEAGEKRGMLHVFELLAESEIEEVSDMGVLLLEKSTNSVLNVAFSRGEHVGINLKSKITVLGIKNLTLPAEDSKLEITPSEREGLVILYAIGYFCKKFGSDDHTEESLTVMDELWLFKVTSVGSHIIDSIKRLGRSQNNFLLVGTQSVLDLGSGDDTGFGTVFAFYENKDPDRVLEFLKLPVNKETQECYRNMTMAQCFYSDTFGRIERITVDGTIYPEMAELFKTVNVKDKEEKVSWEV